MTVLAALGDVHLGKGSHLSPTRLAEQEMAFRTILTDARRRDVEGVLLAGDLFDKRRPSPEEILAAERPLVEHLENRGGKVVATVGNHDIADRETGCGLDVLGEAGLVELHRDPGCTFVTTELIVAVLPWAPASRLRASLPEMPGDEVNAAIATLLVDAAGDLYARIPETITSVLMTHFAIDQSTLPSGLEVATLREPVLSAADLAEIGFPAIVAGHIHTPQVIGRGALGPAFVYTGSATPLDFGDCDMARGYWIVEPDVPSAEFVPIESPPFVTLDLGDYRAMDFDDWPAFEQGAYVRVRGAVPSDGTPPDQRVIRDRVLDLGAAYATVEISVERTVRARVELDTDEEIDEFGVWAAAAELDAQVLAELAVLDQSYRQRVAA